MNYLLAFSLALAISLVVTPLVRRLALAVGAVDRPDNRRKIHQKLTPRLGGLAMYLAFAVTVLIHLPFSRSLAGLLAGTTLLVIVGVVDDLHDLNPWIKLFWQVVAAGVVLAGGLGIISITNPLGGVIRLDYGRVLVHWGSWRFHITPIANVLSIIWMVGLVNATNFLDGLDGLASGVGTIGALVLFLLSVNPHIHQPESALIAIILAGAALGFLPYNFYPARIFMGDSGSYFLGLTLAVLAIYSGAKLATAALVMGFTIIDGLWAVVRRLWHRTSPFRADRHHLHHLFLDVGFSQRQAVLTLYFVAALFGGIALISGSYAKLIALIILVFSVMVLIAILLAVSWRQKRISSKP